MKNIILLCSDGMSTSLIARKMQEEAKAKNYEATVSAHGMSELMTLVSDADCILLGPQVRFNLKKVQKAAGDIPCDCIDMMSYGRCDGKAALEQARKMMND